MKPIEDYTADELSEKIEAIKAERERTANALKRYEEELERRKQEVPLGVPLEDETLSNQFRTYAFDFTSEDSACVFDGRLKDFVEALRKLAKGEPIDIQVLLPLLKKGWVWMQDDRRWYWSKEKPEIFSNAWRIWNDGYYTSIFAFNLKPAENWETSLMECGL